MVLFQQTLRELDAIFYATFPAAALQLKFEQQQQQQFRIDLHDDYDDVPPLVHAYHTLREQAFPAAALQLKFEQQQQQFPIDLHDYDDVPPLVHAYHTSPPPPPPPDYRPAAPPPDLAQVHALAQALALARAQAHVQAQAQAQAHAQVMRLSPLPPNRQPLDKKPPLACLFCRGRKIACGSPLPGSPDKTCNQCQRRSLQCEYPSESRRGMRKKKSVDTDPVSPPAKPL